MDQNYPDDSGVYHRTGVVHDLSFSLKTRPRWHYMNHRHVPNTFMTYLPRERNIIWISLRRIDVGEELTFNYGTPDENWKEN